VNTSSLFVVCSLTLVALLGANATGVAQGDANSHPGVVSTGSVDCGGEPCDAVARGLVAFFDRRLDGLDGNGRACADCHMPADQFQLSPASAEARFALLQWRRQENPEADDPLFRPIDADDFRVNGDAASDFSNLHQNGLVRITIPLPPKVRLIDPVTNAVSDATFADVWRMVPSVNNVALTGPDLGTSVWPRDPNPTGGYQLDARLQTLQEQALGALVNHAQIEQTAPPRLLDDLTSFQRVLFTNPRVRALAHAVRTHAPALTDPDPPLSRLGREGKAVFDRACAQCHGGPGLSTPEFPVNRFTNISSQCPRPVDTASPPRFAFAACPQRLARNARTYEITLSLPTQGPTGVVPAGTKVRRTSSDPGRALLTGFAGGPGPQDDWDKFDVPGLHGISRTAPYFHNNSAATLEEVVDHYIEFFKRVVAITPAGTVSPVGSTNGIDWDRAPRPEERRALLAYLRKL
jgi:cytochrome c peroxidase